MNPLFLPKLIEFISKFNLLDNGYNVINTLTYSILGILIYFLVIYPYLVFRRVKINFNFILSVLIFVFIGAILRMFSLEFTSIGGLISVSQNPFSLGFYFYYPNLFLFLALFFLIVFELSNLFSKKFNLNSEKVLIYFSLIIFLPLFLLVLINILNLAYFLKIIFFSILILFIVYYIFRLFKSNLLDKKVNQLTLFSQITDSFTTFFAIVFIKSSFIEKHVLSHLIISVSPYLFLFIKILFCILLIYLIDRYIHDSFLNNYFKLFIIIIGFTTGVRNLLIIGLAIL
jgi:uncharacterized membrane protein